MGMFNCPVASKCRLTSKFGWRDIGRGREWHQGVDLAGPSAGLKVPVYASADGVVKKAGALSSYGNRVLITHIIGGKTWETNYAHLDIIMVKEGQRVKQGEQIGIMGNTSGGLIKNMGVHLHFEIHNGLYAPGQPNAVDPMKYITLESFAPLTVENKEVQSIKKEGELTMKQYEELTAKIAKLEKELQNKLDKVEVREVLAVHKEDWEWFKANGITDGSNPQNYVTREQVASLIKKYDNMQQKRK